MKVLVTGAAGFIGFYLARKLLEAGHEVVGLDNLNDYYDVSLKQSRLDELSPHPAFRFIRMDLADRQGMAALFASERFDKVAHMAAQAGVSYSLDNSHAYVDSNLVGFVNILEGCRHHGVKHLVYASSSSVYGENDKTPFAETDNVDHPLSLYAATKKSNELMAHTYSHLYRFPATGLRFFTVYGPWGRPDMALFKFVRAILAGEPIDVYNHGNMARDFTYVDDIVEGVVRALGVPLPVSDGSVPHRIFNIGRGQPVQLVDFIAAIEQATGRVAVRNMMPMQPGDVPVTWADTSSLFAATGYRPEVAMTDGVARFVEWYRHYYRV